MTAPKTHTRRVCFHCGAHRSIEESEPVMRGGIVKWACIEHGFNAEQPIPEPVAKVADRPTRLTDAHLKALTDCLDVADPCDEDGAHEFVTEGYTPAFIHATAMEALAILQGTAKPPRRTIVVYMEGGLIDNVVTDAPLGEDLPAILVVDYDIEGTRCPELICEIPNERDTTPALVFDHSAPDHQPGVVGELYDAMIKANWSKESQLDAIERQDDGMTPLHDERELTYDEVSHGGGPFVPLSSEDQARQNAAEDRLFPGLRQMEEENRAFERRTVADEFDWDREGDTPPKGDE